MKKILLLLYVIIFNITCWANDGVYYTSGNQLIPITETQISVQKEILDITQQDSKMLVHVYYEFYNPGEEKTLLVGFEALPPSGAWSMSEEEYKKLTDHPYIQDFTVKINGQSLKYQVSHVDRKEENYYQNGKFKELTKQQELEFGREMDFGDYIPFLFVYHFNATFKKGLNIVEHTYTFNKSMYVGVDYTLDYVLTAANRWANHQIDDFTMNLNMGDRTSFDVQATFFKGEGGWTINGIGRKNLAKQYENYLLRFHIQQGSVTFHKKNFHPEGELELVQTFYVEQDENVEPDDCEYYYRYNFKKAYPTHMMMYFGNYDDSNCKPLSPELKKILRNLPFATRGYVFKTKAIQDYYESTDWYVANPDYVSDMKDLSENEREWVEYWTQQQKH